MTVYLNLLGDVTYLPANTKFFTSMFPNTRWLVTDDKPAISWLHKNAIKHQLENINIEYTELDIDGKNV